MTLEEYKDLFKELVLSAISGIYCKEISSQVFPELNVVRLNLSFESNEAYIIVDIENATIYARVLKSPNPVNGSIRGSHQKLQIWMKKVQRRFMLRDFTGWTSFNLADPNLLAQMTEFFRSALAE
jgi:hypothetical protein